MRALRQRGVKQALGNTGQHYDANMSDVFFLQLAMPEPDVNMGVGSRSHTKQTTDVMARFEPVELEHKPDVVLVYGDVNATVASALVCAKLLVPVGHVEAGLRSFDRTMPEEINRLVTDQLAGFLFTPSEDGDINLYRKGVSAATVVITDSGGIQEETTYLRIPCITMRNNTERPIAITMRYQCSGRSGHWPTSDRTVQDSRGKRKARRDSFFVGRSCGGSVSPTFAQCSPGSGTSRSQAFCVTSSPRTTDGGSVRSKVTSSLSPTGHCAVEGYGFISSCGRGQRTGAPVPMQCKVK